MKKIFAAILALSLLLTACSGASSSAPAPSSQPEAASSSQEAPSASSGETLKIGLVQMMEHPSLDEIREAFLAELKAQGYDDSKVVIDYQNGQGDMGTLNTIAQKFVGDGVDMIVAIATPAAQAAAAATDSTPIIFSAVTDPVDAGLVSDLEAPDRNLTGTSDAIPVDRIFALADELTPGIKTYGLLYNNGESNSVSVIRDVKVALNAAGIAFEEATVINSSEVTTAAQSLVGKVDAIFSPIDNTVAYAMPNLAQIAIEAKLPVYVAADSMVNDGGLATVGVNYTQLGKQTAQMAAEVLSGKPVSEVPVQVLSEYATVVNPDTAAAIGVDVSKYVK
ncbi:MAG: ABC transporter substrate-binding protein [Oscillospiraceae bacterium]|nr:ABC transporter substrate-binding protein [Oscillospiraceae bacterium]MCM0704069.1 ABC transporter substrate-binding protein [Faecalicatena sp. BF-R-105]MDY3219770.1 ABC transporter substrate-binding protein [Candidatus Fimivivens sp.]SFJ26749.1 putative ABC transport system substrate-binding protein [Ruminococcaceae bacterium D5]GKH52381.1 peptide ABC transporter substrate-binding protein [Eubacteriales bacterium]